MESQGVEEGIKELERVDLLHRRAIKVVNFMIQITPSSRTPLTARSRNLNLHRVAPHQMDNSQSEAQEVLTIAEEAALAFPPVVVEQLEICSRALDFSKM